MQIRGGPCEGWDSRIGTGQTQGMSQAGRGGERQGKSGSRIPRNGDRAGGDGGGTGEDVI